MMDYDGEVYLHGNDGRIIECDVLLTYEENGHKYIVYTDKTLHYDLELKAYVSEVVDNGGDKPQLIEVEDNDILKKLQDKLDELTPILLEEKRKLSEENG